MTVSFNRIPDNVRVPLFYGEVDNSRANIFSQNLTALLIAQTVTDVPEVPVFISSVKQAGDAFGIGSMAMAMYDVFAQNNPYSEVWILPVKDASGAAARTVELAVDTVTLTQGQSLDLYVGHQKMQVGLAKGDDETAIAAKIKTVLDNYPQIPVTAAVTGAAVTLTARNAGTVANGVAITYTADEVTIVTTDTAGATDPDITSLLDTVIADLPYEYFVCPFNDATNVGAMKDFLTGRWEPDRMSFGHAFFALDDTVQNLKTAGDAHNDQHLTMIGTLKNPSWTVETLAAYAGQASLSLNINPARPLQTLALQGVGVPEPQDQMSYTDKNTLLFSGISPLEYDSGVPRIVRAITTYKLNGLGAPDVSYLDITTPATNARILRVCEQMITTKFGRVNIADDGTKFGAGLAIVTPKIIRGELIAVLRSLEFQGLVENVDTSIEFIVVERNVNDPTRVDCILPPDLVNPLAVFAMQLQFRLQFS